MVSKSSPEYHRAWRAAHPGKQAEYNRRHIEKVKAAGGYKALVKRGNDAYRARHGEEPEYKARKAEWQHTHLENLRMASLKHRLARRAAMIEAYGGRCACCGESEPTFLTLDHEDGTGAEDRRSFRTSHNAGRVAALARAGWPQDAGYRLLCWNCQYGTYRGTCPHQAA